MALSAEVETHSSNFGRVAKRSSTIPVANLVKSLLYSKAFSTTQHEDDAKKQYLEYLQSSGYPAAAIKESGLVIDNTSSLACSPNGLVDIPGEEGGIVEFKCLYTVVKKGLDPLSTAKTLKMFFCKASIERNLELK